MGKEETGSFNSSGCVKCGKCQTVCPIFAVRQEESSAARGKLALTEAVNQGHLEESRVYRDYLEMCLLCGACQEHCPNEVQTLSKMLDARKRLAENRKSKPAKKLILEQVVGGPRLLDLVLRAGRAFQGLIFRRIPSESGIRRRIPLPLITNDRTLPGLAPIFFTERYKGQVSEGQGPRVGIFAGCMTNYFYADTGEAMVDLLKGLDASVFVPGDQVCCGMPALTGGEADTVRQLAVRNLEAFETHDLDAIVTGCASCGGNLKENYGSLLREAGIDSQRIEKFTSGVMDINEFLHRYGKTDPCRDKTHETGEFIVTYHHPCHLGRLQDIKTEPIELIRLLPGVKFVPMEGDDECCGMGGSFSLENYEVSKKVNDQKISRILATGADAVVTSCPACIMHLRDGLIRNGRGDLEVLHVTELLNRFECSVEKEQAGGEGEEQYRSADVRG